MNEPGPASGMESRPHGNPVIDFLAAMQFLTWMPPIIRRGFTDNEMARAVGYYPLVGLVIGLILASAARLLGLLFPLPVSSALLLACWVVSSGGLHVDGFLDACDGLLGGSTPESRLAIMHDHRIGSFAFCGGLLLFLVKFTALTALTARQFPALLLAPVLGRWVMSLAVVVFPYGRPQGLGKNLKAHSGWQQAALATAIALGVAWFSAGLRGLVSILIALVVAAGIVRFTLRRIPGLTGDIYGALNESIEVVVLLVFCSLH